MDKPGRTSHSLQNMQPIPVCLDDEILKQKIFKSVKLCIQIGNEQHSGLGMGNRSEAEYKFGQGRSNFIGHMTQTGFQIDLKHSNKYWLH